MNLFDVTGNVTVGRAANTGIPSTNSFGGGVDINQRTLTVTPLNFEGQVSLGALDTKYLGGGSSYDESTQRVNEVADQIRNKVATFNGTRVYSGWNNQTEASATDGLRDIKDAAVGANIYAGGFVKSAVTGANTAGSGATNIITRLRAMIALIPADAFDREDHIIVLNASDYSLYLQALANLSLTASIQEFRDQQLSITAVQWLDDPRITVMRDAKYTGGTGNNAASPFIFQTGLTRIGTNDPSDISNFSAWYDINTDMVRWRVKDYKGVQVAAPGYGVEMNIS